MATAADTIRDIDGNVLSADERHRAIAAARADLAGRQAEANRRDSALWARVSSRDEWEAFSRPSLAALRRSLGPPVEDGEPPDTHVTASIEADGYRIENGDRSLIYIPDNEMQPPGEKTIEFDALADFCRDVDVLIHDAQYLPEDMPQKHGWGHSVVDHVLELAAAARVKQLILFHHDPDRTDAAVAEIEKNAREWFAANCPEVECSAAREGMEFIL